VVTVLGHDIVAALPELRAQAESLMVDRCDIHRATTAWDEALQKSVATWAPVHLDVPCALDIPPATARALVTDESVTPEAPVVKVSVDLAGIEPDDRVTIVGVGVAWVTHVPTRSNQVQRRLDCRWTR
jgi:hypothetical protein